MVRAGDAVTSPVLVADCVGRAFGESRVLTAASLRAVPGEVRVLLGRNGCGKSTLLRIACGLLRADTGGVFLDGTFVERPSLPRLARAGVFFLPDHELLSDAFTLGEQLHFHERGFRRGTVRDAAERTGMAGALGRRPSSLSGGELRRAEMAMVLANGPRVLLADEPFRGIAPVDHAVLAGLFRELAARGCAVVITGHEVPSLMELADHITWCTAGTTVEIGPPTVAARHDGFRRDYLGSWYHT